MTGGPVSELQCSELRLISLQKVILPLFLVTFLSKVLTDLENTRSPFVSFSSASQEDPAMLMMEVLDVKECPWPEPTGKVLLLVGMSIN